MALSNVAEFAGKFGACGSACGASDEPKPSACGSACGASGGASDEPKPSACGASGASDK